MSAETPAHLSNSGELANTITHGVGFLLALAGAVALMIAVSAGSEPWLITGCGIYVVTLVSVYAASTLSHAIQQPRTKRALRTIDQAAIFLMAAGNFTPFALAYTCHDAWWSVLVAMWVIAFVGFISKMLWNHRVDAVCIVSYVLLGWMPALVAKPALQHAPLGAIIWSVLGGLCYTAGTFFLVRDDKYPSFHAIWHILVIAGSTCHFFVIMHYVVV